MASKEQKTGFWSRGRDSGGFWGVLRFEKDERRAATQNKMPERKTEFVALKDAGGSKTLCAGARSTCGGPLFPLPRPQDFLGSWLRRSRYTRLTKFFFFFSYGSVHIYTYIHIAGSYVGFARRASRSFSRPCCDVFADALGQSGPRDSPEA